MRYPKVSLLILNWNGIEFTRKCLRSLLMTSYSNFEIILVDNNSDNREAEHLKKELENQDTRIIKSKKNLGYAGGMNLAARYAKGKYIMFLNNDMEFPRNWLMPLVDTLSSGSQLGACQPKIKDLKNNHHFEYAAAAGGFIDVFGYPFARGRFFSDV